MRTKLVYAGYDENTGVSTVGLGSKYGIFWGHSALLEEDREYESEFRGCSYAETKAYIKIKKAELKDLKAQLKGMVNLYKSIKNYKDADKVTLHYMKKQIEIQHNKIEQLIQEIKDIEAALLKSFETDIETVKKIRNITKK